MVRFLLPFSTRGNIPVILFTIRGKGGTISSLTFSVVNCVKVSFPH